MKHPDLLIAVAGEAAGIDVLHDDEDLRSHRQREIRQVELRKREREAG